MARMYSRRGGKSGSRKPILKKAAWVKYKQNEIEDIIIKLARKGYPTARIGQVLRDEYGIPSARLLTNEKLYKILKKNDLQHEIPEDMYNLIKKAVDLIAHLEKNKRDYISKRGLELTESKIRRMAKYYKRENRIPKGWKWDPEKAKLMVK
jgi:small subunit ribosomal protein S15